MSIELIAQKISSTEINAVVFDLDGTLYPSTAGLENQIKPQMWKCLAKELDIDVDNAHSLMWECIQEYETEAVGLKEKYGIDLDAFYQKVFDGLDISVIEPRKGLAEEVSRLSAFIPLHLITNSSRSHAHRVLKKLNVKELFCSITSFEDTNYIRKPDQRAFKYLISKIGTPENKALMFDDSMPNLWACYNMGMHTVQVSNNLANPPMFMEMHMRVKHEAPEFVVHATHNLTETIREVCNRIETLKQ